jgi:hypothetical protein
MKKIVLLIALLALLSSFTYGEVLVQEDTSETFYVENYQIREVPQFYVDYYDIEVPYMSMGYVSGNVKDGLPQGFGNLKIFDYNQDGSLKRTMKFIGDFEDGILVGEAQVFINYEGENTELAVEEITGNFYYGLLHGQATVIMRGFNSDINNNQIIVYDGIYKFGDKEGLFTERNSIDGNSTKTTGEFNNDVKVGEWVSVVETE